MRERGTVLPPVPLPHLDQIDLLLELADLVFQ